MKKHDYILTEIFVMVACVIAVWFIAQSLYSSWSKTYSDNLEVTLNEVCSQHDGNSFWSQTEPEEGESPRPVFKCYLW